MRTLLFIIAVVLVIIWAIGFLAFNAENAIHILLVFAAVSAMQGFIKGEGPVYLKNKYV